MGHYTYMLLLLSFQDMQKKIKYYVEFHIYIYICDNIYVNM